MQKKSVRDTTVGVRLTKGEVKNLTKLAIKQGLSLSTFIRSVTLNSVGKDFRGE
jgi:predicted DNA binding CopG/RHH family protein